MPYLRCLLFSAFLFNLTLPIFAQDTSTQLEEIRNKQAAAQAVLNELSIQKEKILFRYIPEQLKAVGLPSDDYIEHNAMILSYNEQHEQANWVSHIIMPDIKKSFIERTNDFRVDSLIESGSAIQDDYFLVLPDSDGDGEPEYDGFGYDRGHLAPSADFRWSKQALSESYYYSNMSPQLPEFNRDIWGKLEAVLRRYVVKHQVPLYVVTLPILEDDLPVIDRSVNKVSIPKMYAKLAYDRVNGRAIGFVLANQGSNQALLDFAMSVDEVEKLTGFDFYANVSEEIESSFDFNAWQINKDTISVKALSPLDLPKNHFGTDQLEYRVGKETIVCGKVVGTHVTGKKNVMLNIDKTYPNQKLTIFINKENKVNFPHNIPNYTINKYFCFKGEVRERKGKYTIAIDDEFDLNLMEGELN